MEEQEYDAYLEAVEDVKRRLYWYDTEAPEEYNPFGVFD
jgi:hypothetical protein